MDSLRIQTESLENRPRLGTLSCVSLIVNKIIGTGIFLIPAIVLRYCNGSIALSLILWIGGAIISLCGLYVYMEFALNLPFTNGGEKNYLRRVYRKPRGLIGCMYSFYVGILGFSAGNSYAFGKYTVYALGGKDLETQSEKQVTLVAILCVTCCIALHIIHPHHGTRLFNVLGCIKVIILLLIISLGGLTLLGFTNTEPSDNFKNISHIESQMKPNFYYLSVASFQILYSYRGWENVNFVLQEVTNPHFVLTIAAPIAFLFTSFLYLLVILSYLIVVPREEVIDSGILIAGVFFNRILGVNTASRLLPLLIAVSNLGNVMAVSFTHSYVIQELASNNYFPFSKSLQKIQCAFLFHWLITFLALVIPPSAQIYEFLINLSMYPSSIIMLLISVGLLYLKFNRKQENWGDQQVEDESYTTIDQDEVCGTLLHGQAMSQRDLTFDSLSSGREKSFSVPYFVVFIFLSSSLFLITFPFVPPYRKMENTIPYWCFPTVGASVLLLGIIWFYSRMWLWILSYRIVGKSHTLPKYEDDYKKSFLPTTGI